MTKERVLIVDHSPQRRESLKRLLLEREIEVLEAASCEEALQTLSREELSLVLTETELPTKSGLFLLKKARERFPDLAVILITHNASSYNLLQALRHGAYDFIVRPIDTGEILYNALDRHFSHLKLSRQNSGLVRELEEKNRALLHSLKMMKALNESVERLLAAADIEELLLGLLNSAMGVVQAQRGYIALFDRPSGALGILVSKGIPAALIRQCSSSLPQGFTTEVARRAKPILVPGAFPEKLLAMTSEAERQGLLGNPGLLAVPLLLRERVAGIIVLSSHWQRESFTEGDLDFLVQLSHHGALALEKAGVIHQLKRRQ